MKSRPGARLSLVLLIFFTLAESAYPNQVLQSALQWGGRRLFKDLWGVRVRTTLVEPIEKDLSRYHRVEIVPLENELRGLLPEGLDSTITERMAEAVSDAGLFDEVVIVGDGLASAGGPFEEMLQDFLALASQGPETLVIEGAVVDYLRGNRWLRLLSLGLGRGTIVVHLKLLDKRTGKQVGQMSIAGDIISLWGSTEKQVPRAISKRFAKILKENCANQRKGAGK